MAKQFDTFSDHDWDSFANKISMLVEEFEVFKNIASNLLALEAWHDKNIRAQVDNKQELQRVGESAQTSYGFFKKQSKEERLNDLRRADQNLSVDVGVGNELLALIYQVICHHEIPLLKALKKARFDKTIYEFSQSRIQELEKELLLWQTVNLPDQVPDDVAGHDADGKIEKQDFRFTELPRLRTDSK